MHPRVTSTRTCAPRGADPVAAYLDGDAPRSFQLEPMPLTVVDGQGKRFKALLPRDRQDRRGIESTTEEDDCFRRIVAHDLTVAYLAVALCGLPSFDYSTHIFTKLHRIR